jgi:Zn-finger protein
MLPLKLWIRYRVHTAMGGKWIHNFNGNMVQSTHCYGCEVNWQLQKLSIHFASIAVCTLYHVTIEVVNSLPTHSSVYSVPCYHWSCQFMLWVGSELSTSMVTWYRVHTAMGGRWNDNFNGNMVQSTPCYGHVTIEVVNSLPTHSRVYSVPCYH